MWQERPLRDGVDVAAAERRVLHPAVAGPVVVRGMAGHPLPDVRQRVLAHVPERERREVAGSDVAIGGGIELDVRRKAADPGEK